MIIFSVYTIIFVLFSIRFLLKKDWRAALFLVLPWSFFLLFHMLFSRFIFEKNMDRYTFKETIIQDSEFLDAKLTNRMNTMEYLVTYKTKNGDIIHSQIDPEKIIGDISRPGRLRLVSRNFTSKYILGNIHLYVIVN